MLRALALGLALFAFTPIADATADEGGQGGQPSGGAPLQVPEPSTLSLLLAGAGAVGGATWLRKRGRSK